jgi:hypothetical protein
MRTLLLWLTALLGAVACGSGGGGPPGSCKTGGTATGSFLASCNQCAEANCNTELSAKSGSGWASQYFGGDGACVAFNGCLCSSLASGGDPLACATKLDTTCSDAIQAAQQCLSTHCADTCR